MSFVCLSIRSWATAAASGSVGNDGDEEKRRLRLCAALLTIAPHVHVDRHALIWADARGLQGHAIAGAIVALTAQHAGADVRVGAADTAIAAEVAARADSGHESRVILVPSGTDRAFLASCPLAVLERHAPSPRLLPMLFDIGLETCGDLARLTSEALEVRFGADVVALWRLARADDPRVLFSPTPRALPSASIEWEEYVLRDLERLLFVANHLTDTVCTGLRSWGEAAPAMTLTFRLANGTHVDRSIRAATATASRGTWLRLIRAELERATLPDAVTGMSLQVEAATGLETPQGDLFDAGFQSARAVEHALAQLLDDKRATIAGLTNTSHPLIERRATWSPRTVAAAMRTNVPRAAAQAQSHSQLSLQLWPEPRQIVVRTRVLRGQTIPIAYREERATREVPLMATAGPDRVSSDDSGTPYSRVYFQGITPEGTLVLLYRDVAAGEWYLHGWWD